MAKFEERSPITFENEGKKIFGVLHLPIHKSPCPVVFFFHGFAGNKCGSHRIYVNLATALSKIGIASLRIDFRGCGDSEGEIKEMTLESEISDALLACTFIESQPSLDASRLGFIGKSLGGAVAVMTANRYKNVKSIALWAPVFSAQQWKKEWEKAKLKMEKKVAADEAIRINGEIAGEGFVKEMFAMQLDKELAEIESVPLMHIHGEGDTIVGVEHAELFRKHRHQSKGHSHFIRMPHADHDFSIIEMQRQAIEETCQWFKKTL